MTAAARTPARSGRLRTLLARREMSLVLVLVLLLGGFGALNHRFFSVGTFSQILNDMSIVVIVGVGLGIVLLTRNIDVSVGSMVGLTAFFGAYLEATYPAVPLFVVVIAACLLGLLLGSVNGILVATLRVPSIMVTLGTLYVFRGVDSILAGSNQVTAENLSTGYKALATWSVGGVPGMIIYAIVIAFVAHVFIRRTFSGRSIVALGSNPTAADKVGLPTRRWVFIAFALSGLLCGFAGVLWAARYGTVDSSAASGYELVVLAAVVVGGVSVNGGSGSIGGVVVGAAILSTIAIGLALQNVSQFWLQAINGAVILAAIVVDAVIRQRAQSKGIGR